MISELYKTHNMRFSATFVNLKKRERSGAKRQSSYRDDELRWHEGILSEHQKQQHLLL